MVDTRILNRTHGYQAAATAATCAACLCFWREAALGVFLGGLVVAGNFCLMRWLLERLVVPGRLRFWIALALMFKVVAVMAVIALVLWIFAVHALGFAIGMATLLFGIGAAVLHESLAYPSLAAKRM